MRATSEEQNCAALWNALLARDFEQPALYWKFHNLMVDTYCVQHAPYVESAKSLAAHLCGLCVALEWDNNPAVRKRLQRWLSSNPELIGPELPICRGNLTISHVYGIAYPADYGRALEEWARSTWEAHSKLQPIAREWLAMAEAG